MFQASMHWTLEKNAGTQWEIQQTLRKYKEEKKKKTELRNKITGNKYTGRSEWQIRWYRKWINDLEDRWGKISNRNSEKNHLFHFYFFSEESLKDSETTSSILLFSLSGCQKEKTGTESLFEEI